MENNICTFDSNNNIFLVNIIFYYIIVFLFLKLLIYFDLIVKWNKEE